MHVGSAHRNRHFEHLVGPAHDGRQSRVVAHVVAALDAEAALDFLDVVGAQPDFGALAHSGRFGGPFERHVGRNRGGRRNWHARLERLRAHARRAVAAVALSGKREIARRRAAAVGRNHAVGDRRATFIERVRVEAKDFAGRKGAQTQHGARQRFALRGVARRSL